MNKRNIKYALESSSSVPKPTKILCVDDEMYNLEILDKHLKDSGYETILVKSGHEALSALVQHNKSISLVLLDRMMQGMDGIEVLKKMKSEPAFRDIPVIMQTAAAEAKEIIEGIKAGAYYYLTKPYSSDILMAIVRSALSEAEEKEKSKSTLETVSEASQFVKEMVFEYKTVNEAYTLANYIAALFCKNNINILVSLSELMLNAVEHGNLEINHDAKAELVLSGKLWEEINRRMSMPEYGSRKVIVTLRKNERETIINIKDEGKGFDWKEYVDFDPLRMTNPSGRGLAIAHIMSPGSIEFPGNGNEVIFRI